MENQSNAVEAAGAAGEPPRSWRSRKTGALRAKPTRNCRSRDMPQHESASRGDRRRDSARPGDAVAGTARTHPEVASRPAARASAARKRGNAGSS